MTVRNPLPACLSHLAVLRKSAQADGLKEAAVWVEDSKRTMQSDSAEFRWATGARHFLWQLADERIGVAPWSTDMFTARELGRPVMIGKRGSKLMAMAIFHGDLWRHADSLQPVCFRPDVWQPLPEAPKLG